MAFVKLDCGILDSTLWIDRPSRDIFVTALLMAQPHELREPAKQIQVRDLKDTGFEVPAGWYGFVPAAGIGIINRAGMDQEEGLEALERLGNPDPESRSPDFEGRRLIRIDGGYLVLNFTKYREKDATSAERSKRWRQRNKEKQLSTRVSDTSTPVIRHQAEAEAEAEAEESFDGFDEFWEAYPRKVNKPQAKKAWKKLSPDLNLLSVMIVAISKQRSWHDWRKDGGQFIPHPASWLNGERWNDQDPNSIKPEFIITKPTGCFAD